MSTLIPNVLLALSPLLTTPQETVEQIEIYGLRQLDAERVTEVLGLAIGDELDLDRDASIEALRSLEGVDDASIVTIRAVQSTDVTVVVGVLEEASPRVELRDAPQGEVRLPAGYVERYDAIMETSMEGFRKGVGRSDELTYGHPISDYAPTRELQEQLAEAVRVDLALVRRVVRESADAMHRRVAAHALGYVPDKQSIVADLAHGATDPDDGVRNNSVRALGVLLRWSQAGDHGLRFEFDPAPLVALLDSVAWTDRNKGAAILDALSRERDPVLFALLRAQALPALAEMAAWRSDGYAMFSVNVLARLAGETEGQVLALGDRFREQGADVRRAWVARTVASLEN